MFWISKICACSNISSEISNPKNCPRLADVFEYVDSDGDGGLFFDEWQDFNKRNWVFVGYFHCYLTHEEVHIRHQVLGGEDADSEGQERQGHGQLLTHLSHQSRDESWTVADLKDGVIDGRNRPVVTQPWVESDDKKTTSRRD